MGRPKKLLRIKQVQNSLQLFKEGVYVGCISMTDLYQLLDQKRDSGITDIMVQPELINEPSKKGV